MSLNRILLAFLCFSSLAYAIDVTYGFSGIQTDQFSQILNKYPISSLVRVLENMEDDSQLILRPFNFGSTQNYLDHSGLGKNTNVKGKSCYLDDETLNGKITYIQSNEYTGRNQKAEKITYLGKYITKDKVINEVLDEIFADKCSEWKDKTTDQIKKDLSDAIKEKAADNEELEDILQYANARFMWKIDISGEQYLTTEFITVQNVDSNSVLPVTEEVCENHECRYEVSADETTSSVQVLAYKGFNLETCEPVTFQLVADMDILTIHFPDERRSEVDLKKYFGPDRDQYCKDSFKMAFGISPEITIIYDYVEKLMESTAEWGLVRHSIEALNFCFTQNFDREKYYLKLSKSILGRGQITVIWEGKDTKIIPDTVREWVLEGECTPMNPSWIFPNSNTPEALIWDEEDRNSILNSSKFKKNDCPTYQVIQMIEDKGAKIPIDWENEEYDEDKGGRGRGRGGRGRGGRGGRGGNIRSHMRTFD